MVGDVGALYTFLKYEITWHLLISPLKRSLLFGNFNPHLYHEISGNTDRQIWIVSFQTLLDYGTTLTSTSNLLLRPMSKPRFGIHDPQGIKHLLQLRVGLSPRRHKTTHNFLDTPNDWCDCPCAPEDTKHFLLHCHLYYPDKNSILQSQTY